MMKLRAYPANTPRRFTGVGCGWYATMLLVLLCTGSVRLAPAAAAFPAHALQSARQLDGVNSASASWEAQSRPAYRATLQKGTLLVASRYLADPNFARAVVLLVDYGAQGAMGLIINRPTGLTLSEVFPAIGPRFSARHRLYVGGPVAPEQVMLLFRTEQQPKNTVHVFGDIFLGASADSLRQVLSRSEHGESFHAYVGYAGWGPGQLEDEVSRGDWHLLSPDSRTVFDAEPSEIWHELLRQSTGLWVRRGGGLLLRNGFENVASTGIAKRLVVKNRPERFCPVASCPRRGEQQPG